MTCFAMDENERCTAMKDNHCVGYIRCPFYKSKEDNDAELLKYNGTTDLDTIIMRKAIEDSGTPKQRKYYVSTVLPDKVSEENRHIMELYVEGLPLAVIGKEFGISARTVSSRVGRFKKEGYIRVRYNS